MSFSYDEQDLIEWLMEGGDVIPTKTSKCQRFKLNDSLWIGGTEAKIHRISTNVGHIDKVLNIARSILVDLKKEILDDSDSININILDKFIEMHSTFEQIVSMSRDLSSQSLFAIAYQKVGKYIDNSQPSNSICRIDQEIKQKRNAIRKEDYNIEISQDLSKLIYYIKKFIENKASDNKLDNSYQDLVIKFKKDCRELFQIKNSLTNLIDNYDIKEEIQKFNRNKQEINTLYEQFLKEAEFDQSFAAHLEDLLGKQSNKSLDNQLKKAIILNACSWINLNNSAHKKLGIFRDKTVILIDSKGEIKVGINQEEVFNIVMNVIKSSTTNEFQQTPRTAALLNKLIDQHPLEFIGFCTLKNVLLEEKRLLKNAGFDFFECVKNKLKKSDYNMFNGTFFESINDHATYLKNVYNKKQYAHSISSQKYQTLYNEESYRLLSMLYDEGVSVGLLQDAVGKKMASFNTSDDFNSHIKSFYDKKKGFILDKIRDKAIDKGVNIVFSQDNLLILKIDKFEHSKLLGSSSWCISNSRGYFESYTDNRDQYFLFDFNKEASNKYSMIGFTLDKDKSVHAAHSRFDASISSNDLYLKEICDMVIQSEIKNEKKLKFKNN